MNKLQLIEVFRTEAGLTKSEATAIVHIVFDEMSDALARDDRVEIRGLCSFFVKRYKAYTGRNPRTGATAKIKPKKLPFFKPGLELKTRVHNSPVNGEVETEQRSGEDRRYHDATILGPDRRSGKDRRET